MSLVDDNDLKEYDKLKFEFSLERGVCN